MLGRKAKKSAQARPQLLDRVLDSRARRIAVLGIHPRAGSRTVLASLVRDLHRREMHYGLSSFPRLHLDDDSLPEPPTRVALPEGAYVATAETTARADNVELDPLEATGFDSPRGPVGLYRVRRGGEIELCGPKSAAEMGLALQRLTELSGGIALVDGGWGRRGFAAPGVTEAIVIAVGAGYSATPERAAAAARYLVETFGVAHCSAARQVAWQKASEAGVAMLLDPLDAPIGTMPAVVRDPLPRLRAVDGDVACIVLPQALNDDLLGPLVRAESRCALVVRDATKINVAPVYFKAWQKSGGVVQVVRPSRIVGVATNPVNFTGADADPAEFLALVAEAMPGLAVHDVVRESPGPSRRALWKFWE